MQDIEGTSIIGGRSTSRDSGSTTIGFDGFNPTTGRPTGRKFFAATAENVDRAARLAREAFERGEFEPRRRAALLRAIAEEIVALGDDLLNVTAEETGLAAKPRLASERDRAVYHFRMFADVVEDGSWVRAVIDHSDPNRKPMPKPDVRRMLRTLGPVAVFGASNFPIAYGVTGGDTASALAAGCPVIVKGHPAHPATGEILARAVADAANEYCPHPGWFAFLHSGGSRESAVGTELVNASQIAAVGFTGSLGGGMALAKLGASRPNPIPVFAEMGSVNPVFVLPAALAKDGNEIADKLAASATNSSGQMCTCPGLVFVAESSDSERFIAQLSAAFARMPPMTMLSPRTRDNFASRLRDVRSVPGVSSEASDANATDDVNEYFKREHHVQIGPQTELAIRAWLAARPTDIDETMEVKGRDVRSGEPHRLTISHAMLQANIGAGRVAATPTLLRVAYRDFAKSPTLHEEVFGPKQIVVVCASVDELFAAAENIHGSLTGSIFADTSDRGEHTLAAGIRDRLERRVGRLIHNGVPTGVEVCDAMVHSGPFPACSRPDSTAVGRFAIERWCRPVCYQNVADALLPPELQEANPRRIFRVVDGGRVEPAQ